MTWRVNGIYWALATGYRGPGPGDWPCPQCANNVFANRAMCPRCQCPKPAHIPYRVDYQGPGGNQGRGVIQGHAAPKSAFLPEWE